MLTYSLYLVLFVLSFCLLLVAIRFALGPALVDRITAFDLFVADVICIICVYAIISGYQGFMDVAIILSLFGFLGSVCFAYYLLKNYH